jgi:hypothetical protein
MQREHADVRVSIDGGARVSEWVSPVLDDAADIAADMRCAGAQSALCFGLVQRCGVSLLEEL